MSVLFIISGLGYISTLFVFILGGGKNFRIMGFEQIGCYSCYREICTFIETSADVEKREVFEPRPKKFNFSCKTFFCEHHNSVFKLFSSLKNSPEIWQPVKVCLQQESVYKKLKIYHWIMHDVQIKYKHKYPG